MKKYIIVPLLFLVINCNSDKGSDSTVCKTENLEIDEISKFSFRNTELSIPVEYKWQWNIKNDTIEVSGIMGQAVPDGDAHMFFKKNGDCIDYLFTRLVEQDDDHSSGGETCDYYSKYEFYYTDFKIQKYIANEVLIGQVGGTKFWIDFTEETHVTTPWDYESCYP